MSETKIINKFLEKYTHYGWHIIKCAGFWRVKRDKAEMDGEKVTDILKELEKLRKKCIKDDKNEELKEQYVKWFA